MQVDVEHAYKWRQVKSKAKKVIFGYFTYCSGVYCCEYGSPKGAHSLQLRRVLHMECRLDVLLGANKHMGHCTPIVNVMECEKLLILCNYLRGFAMISVEDLTELAELITAHGSVLLDDYKMIANSVVI
jgi:hypothetical protein